MSDEDTQPEYNWHDVSIAMAASNEKLCRIVLAADELAKVTANLLIDDGHAARRRAQEALDAYKIARSGS